VKACGPSSMPPADGLVQLISRNDRLCPISRATILPDDGRRTEKATTPARLTNVLVLEVMVVD
jgi:hypothetical protein